MAKKPKAPTFFSDMGSKHAAGIGTDPKKDAKMKERQEKAGKKHVKGPTVFSDMGEKDAVGVGEGK